MTIPGTGSGGAAGAPQQPTIQEQQQSATAVVGKMIASLLQDTLEVPFSQLGGNIWKYQSNANRPTIPPLFTDRVGTPPTQTDDSWKANYDALKNLLSSDLSESFSAAMQLPADQRNMAFLALDTVLTTVAKTLAWAEAATVFSTDNPVVDTRGFDYSLLPYVAMGGILASGNAVNDQLNNFLDTVGANYPNHDELKGYLRNLGLALEDLSTLSSSYVESETIDNEAASTLAADVALLNSQMAVYPGTEGTILAYTVDSLATLTAALALAGESNPSLALSLAFGNVGISSDVSAAGFVGPTLTSMAADLSAGIGGTFMPEADPGSQMMLNLAVNTLIVGSLILGSLMGDLGDYQQLDGPDAEAAKSLTTDLLISMASTSGLTETVAATLANLIAQDNQQTQDNMEEILKLTILQMTIMGAISKAGDIAAATIHFENLKDHLGGSYDDLSDLINQQLMEQTDRNDSLAQVGMALQQSSIALENSDYEGFLEANLTLLNLVDSDADNLMKDTKQVQDYTATVGTNLTRGDDTTTTLTGITVAA